MQLQVSRLKQRVINPLQALSQISPSPIPSYRLMVSLIITAGANKAAFLMDRHTDRQIERVDKTNLKSCYHILKMLVYLSKTIGIRLSLFFPLCSVPLPLKKKLFHSGLISQPPTFCLFKSDSQAFVEVVHGG